MDPLRTGRDTLRSAEYKFMATTKVSVTLLAEFRQNGGDVSIACRL
jgi:hypothetical protein